MPIVLPLYLTSIFVDSCRQIHHEVVLAFYRLECKFLGRIAPLLIARNFFLIIHPAL